MAHNSTKRDLPSWVLPLALVLAAAGSAAVAREFLSLRGEIANLKMERDEFSEELGKVESAKAALRGFGLDYYGLDNLRLLTEKDRGRRVVFFGDSITEFWSLGSAFPGLPVRVVNRGIKAQLTEHLLARLYFDVIQLRPWALVLTAGTNDALRLVPAERIEQNLDVLILAAHRSGILVFVGTLPPVEFKPEEPRDRARAIDETMRGLNAWVARRCDGAVCTALDFHAALKEAQKESKLPVLKDGVHPNERGYAAMEKVARAALQRRLR